MTNAIAKSETVREIQPATHAATTPMQLMQAMIERGTTPDELEKMLSLQERWEANQARKSFAAAMAHFQANCPTILKSKKADRYSYAPLDEILRTIRPHLDSAGLSVAFNTSMKDAVITAYCTVTHRDGHSVTSEFSAPVDPAMKVNETQKAGSANSYARRYALCNALNLVASNEDDDGYAAETSFISDDQMAALQKDLETLGVNKVKFCKFMAIDSIKEMPLAKLEIAQNFIANKRAAQGSATEK